MTFPRPDGEGITQERTKPYILSPDGSRPARLTLFPFMLSLLTTFREGLIRSVAERKYPSWKEDDHQSAAFRPPNVGSSG